MPNLLTASGSGSCGSSNDNYAYGSKYVGQECGTDSQQDSHRLSKKMQLLRGHEELSRYLVVDF